MGRLCALRVGMFVLVSASVAAAQDVPQLTVGRLADGEGPAIDGRVDEVEWERAQPYGAFVQQEPDEGLPATERTEIRFLIDQRNLYIAIICYDSTPGEIVVSESRRDASLTDTDSIEILLDTFNDGQNAFVFGTNPFGIELDGQVMGEGQNSGGGFIASGVGGSQARAGARVQRQLGRRLDRAREHDRPGLGSRVRNPAQDAALQPGVGSHVGRQRDAQHPAQERAGFPVAGAARLFALPRLCGRQAERPQPADAAGSQVHSVRRRFRQRRQDAPHE